MRQSKGQPCRAAVAERVAVTGGSGFIGTSLVQALLDDGTDVLSIDIREPICPSHRQVWRQLDIRCQEDLCSAIRDFGPSHVYHLGARTDLGSASVAEYSENTLGTACVLDACSEISTVSRVLFASSRLVCQIGYEPLHDQDYCPTTAYGESKVVGERMVREHASVPYVWLIVRPTSIWGPWFDVPYRQFFESIKRQRFVVPGHSPIFKSFGYVENTVFQLRQLMHAPRDTVAGKTFYVGDYEPIELGTFARSIAGRFGVRPPVSVPPWVLSVVARTGDVLARAGFDRVPLTSFRLANLRTNMVHDLSALAAVTGPLPFTVEQGIERTVEWMRTH